MFASIRDRTYETSFYRIGINDCVIDCDANSFDKDAFMIVRTNFCAKHDIAHDAVDRVVPMFGIHKVAEAVKSAHRILGAVALIKKRPGTDFYDDYLNLSDYLLYIGIYKLIEFSVGMSSDSNFITNDVIAECIRDYYPM